VANVAVGDGHEFYMMPGGGPLGADASDAELTIVGMGAEGDDPELAVIGGWRGGGTGQGRGGGRRGG
jgi:hypothetical protein